MNRDIFETGMLEPRKFNCKDNMEMMKVLQAHNGSLHCCMFAMEELAELSKEISKIARGEGDYYNVLQELADVAITVNNVLMMNNYIYNEDAPLVIGSEELDKAMNVKLTAKMEQLGYVPAIDDNAWNHVYDGLDTIDI